MKRKAALLAAALALTVASSPIYRGTPPLEWQCWQTHGQAVHPKPAAKQVWHCFTAKHPQRG